MQRTKIKAATVAFVSLLIVGLSSEARAQSGNYGDLLRHAISAAAKGDCPADVLSPLTVGQCMQAMPAISQKLTALGDVSGMQFLGQQPTPQGTVEVYLVSFANGRMTWMINTGPDGKVLVLWSPN